MDKNGRLASWLSFGAVIIFEYIYFYFFNDKRIYNLKTKMKQIPIFSNILGDTYGNFFYVWLVLAAIGFGSTLGALICFTEEPPDTNFGYFGFYTFMVGAVLWPFFADKKYEVIPLSITSFGAVIWAADTRFMWGFVVVSAAYHVIVDACVYLTVLNDRIDFGKFAGWSGYLAFLHYIFAAFITSRTITAKVPFNPEINLYYNQWEITSGDSCSDAECIVYHVYSSFGRVDIGYAVAAFSWISGTNHLITYIGLFLDSSTIISQIDGDYGNFIRSADWFFSASLMMSVNYFLFEVPGSIMTLAAVFSATALVITVGYLTEVLKGYECNSVKWISFTIAGILFTLLWIPLFTIMATFDSSTPANNVSCVVLPSEISSPPTEVYFFIIWLVISFYLFPFVHIFKLRGNDNFRYEIWFAILSFLSKLPLLAVYYGGILSRENTRFSTEPPRPVSDGTLYLSIGVGVSIACVSAIAMIISFRETLGLKKSTL